MVKKGRKTAQKPIERGGGGRERKVESERVGDGHVRRTKITVKKLTIGQKMRDFNILFPWFKVVAGLMLVLTAVFSAWGMLRHSEMAPGAQEEVMAAKEVMDEDSGELNAIDDAEEEEQGELRVGVSYVRSKPANLPVRKPKDKKLIALTFDDGPSPATTPRLLDILQEKKVKATFFVIGRMAQAAPEILKREEQAGHVVGSHTMGHVDLTTLDLTGVQQEVVAMDGVFQANLGHVSRLTRPPYGAINDTVKTGIQQPLVIWTIDPEDWKVKDAAAVRKHVTERAFDGAIVLMHDIYGSTVDAVGGMIDDLRKEGYEFLTVSEMAQARGVKLDPGAVYGSFRP